MFQTRKREDALSNAWQVHSAHTTWIAQADAKAAFSFTIQSAVIAAIISLLAAGKLVANVWNWWTVGFLVGLLFLAVGAVIAARVVTPRLRANKLKIEAQVDAIYFGHTRLLQSDTLERRLRDSDLLPALSRQIVRLAEIAWSKHVGVRWSIWFGVTGGLVLAVTAVASWMANS